MVLLEPYKSALIAARHRPLRIAAIDDGATIDEAAAPHDVLIEKLKKFTIQPSKVKLLLSLSLFLSLSLLYLT